MMRNATVLERRMAYAEAGTGDPIVFLHGNAACSPWACLPGTRRSRCWR